MRKRLLAGLILAHPFGSGASWAQVASPSTMVFFDWGKAEIQRDYVTALDEIGAAAAADPGARLVVEGHSDRSGPAGASRRASLQRAAIVRDHLVGRGVPAMHIEVRAWGEERPLIATADGVREPQNRRAEVRVIASGDR